MCSLFKVKKGPAKIIPTTLLQIFKLFLTTALVELIIRQTNIYAQQVMGDVAFSKWKPVCYFDGNQSPAEFRQLLEM